jgi:hypothetical protein
MSDEKKGSGEHRFPTPPPERPQETIGEHSVPYILSHAKTAAAKLRGKLASRPTLQHELDVLEKVIAACESWKESGCE